MPMTEGSRLAVEGTVKVPGGVALGDGILNVNKAKGWTSHDVVAKLRGLLGGLKVGHAGTLDPAATGVLPVLVGRGTRIAEYLMDWDKEYHAVLRLGETTDTQDATGVVLTRSSTDSLTESAIRATIQQFQGKLTQVPPMYSAVKVGGVPLYKVARAGRTVQRGPREVVVHEIEVLGIVGRDVSLRVVCSKGTYVRTLCADIGETLGVGGHLMALERKRVGPLTVEHALSVEAIGSRFLVGRLGEDVMSLDAALESLLALVLDQATSARVLHGVQVPFGALKWDERTAGMASGRPIRLKDPSGRLLALGMMSAGNKPVMRILKVLADG